MAARPAPPTGTDPEPPEQGPRTSWMVLGAVVLLLLAASLFGGRDTSSDTAVGASSGTATGAPPPRPGSATNVSPSVRPVGRHLPRSKPLRLLIPKISVDAPFTDLAIAPNGQLEPPPADDVNLVGWHAKGASPGETGTSIIAGHVDTATSAAVFAGLSELEKGDVFSVVRADRRRASFVVDSVETFEKDRFPSRRVYADTPEAQVRLITCAGDYDRSVRDYTDNLVVFAHLM